MRAPSRLEGKGGQVGMVKRRPQMKMIQLPMVSTTELIRRPSSGIHPRE